MYTPDSTSLAPLAFYNGTTPGNEIKKLPIEVKRIVGRNIAEKARNTLAVHYKFGEESFLKEVFFDIMPTNECRRRALEPFFTCTNLKNADFQILITHKDYTLSCSRIVDDRKSIDRKAFLKIPLATRNKVYGKLWSLINFSISTAHPLFRVSKQAKIEILRASVNEYLTMEQNNKAIVPFVPAALPTTIVRHVAQIPNADRRVPQAQFNENRENIVAEAIVVGSAVAVVTSLFFFFLGCAALNRNERRR